MNSAWERPPEYDDPPDATYEQVSFILPKCPRCAMSKLSPRDRPIVRDPSHDGFKEFYPIIVPYECRNCCYQFSVHFAALMICGMG